MADIFSDTIKKEKLVRTADGRHYALPSYGIDPILVEPEAKELIFPDHRDEGRFIRRGALNRLTSHCAASGLVADARFIKEYADALSDTSKRTLFPSDSTQWTNTVMLPSQKLGLARAYYVSSASEKENSKTNMECTFRLILSLVTSAEKDLKNQLRLAPLETVNQVARMAADVKRLSGKNPVTYLKGSWLEILDPSPLKVYLGEKPSIRFPDSVSGNVRDPAYPYAAWEHPEVFSLATKMYYEMKEKKNISFEDLSGERHRRTEIGIPYPGAAQSKLKSVIVGMTTRRLFEFAENFTLLSKSRTVNFPEGYSMKQFAAALVDALLLRLQEEAKADPSSKAK